MSDFVLPLHRARYNFLQPNPPPGSLRASYRERVLEIVLFVRP